MSDISLHITWVDLLLAAPVIGWPGLILGAALGAALLRKRRVLGAIVGGLLGCAVWFAAPIFLKLF